jgi:hypothetical protein
MIGKCTFANHPSMSPPLDQHCVVQIGVSIVCTDCWFPLDTLLLIYPHRQRVHQFSTTSLCSLSCTTRRTQPPSKLFAIGRAPLRPGARCVGRCCSPLPGSPGGAPTPIASCLFVLANEAADEPCLSQLSTSFSSPQTTY